MKFPIDDNIKNVFKNEDYKEILTKGFSFLLVRTIGLFVGFLFTLLIAQKFGASVNGLVSLSFTFILCVSIIGTLGVDINLVRFYSIEDNKKDSGHFYKTLLWVFLASLLLSLIIHIFSNFIVFKVFSKPQFKPYILWTTLTIPAWSIVTACGGFLRAKKENVWFVFLGNSGRFVFSLLFFLVFLLFDSDPLNAIKAHFYGVLLLAVLGVIKSIKILKGITIQSKSDTFVFFKESFPIMVSSSIIMFLGLADTFVLSIYESDSEVGVYNVALRIASLAIFPFLATGSILAPKIAKSYNDNDFLGFKKMIQFANKICFIITITIAIIIVVFQKFLLGLFGEEFLSGNYVLMLLCLGQLIMVFSGFVAIILQMTGNQKIYQNIVIGALILNLILNFTLTPRYGSLGAAVATVTTIAFWNFIGIFYIKKKLNFTSSINFSRNI